MIKFDGAIYYTIWCGGWFRNLLLMRILCSWREVKDWIIARTVPYAELMGAWLGLYTLLYYFKSPRIRLWGDSMVVITWISYSMSFKFPIHHCFRTSWHGRDHSPTFRHYIVEERVVFLFHLGAFIIRIWLDYWLLMLLTFLSLCLPNLPSLPFSQFSFYLTSI